MANTVHNDMPVTDQTRTVLKISAKDNVLVALKDLTKGESIPFEGQTYTLNDTVKAKHKFYTESMDAGQPVTMYGVLVGKTQVPVMKGSLMTTANLKHAAEPYAYREGVNYHWQAPDITRYQNMTFQGYPRSDGRVGTANYWLFIPTVFCENRNLDVIREALQNELGYGRSDKYVRFTHSLRHAFENREDLGTLPFGTNESVKADHLFKNVDGIKFLNHQGGCGGTRQDSAILGSLLASYANHPNVGGITILSLGCQHIQAPQLVAEIKQTNPSFDKPLLVFEQQQSFSEEQLIASAIRETFKGLVELNTQERVPAPLSKLCVGVKCGGSDGFSGVSANPAVGYAADLLVALGAKVLLAEFPELNGVEQNLIDRCVSPDSALKFINLMQTYDAQAHAVGSGFYMNPSPGNIKDGLITDAIKSAGAALKGGTSPVVDVLDYTEPALKPGLSLVCTPGNDVEATTGQASAGANLILFTTGLGTPTGNPVCPVIKLATNTALARRMGDIIDIDCGPVVSGEKSIAEMGHEILDYCIRAASGEVVPRAVELNQDDFIPWKRGVSL